MQKELRMDDIKPVFIMGHPYSATTFLQLLISAHPSFYSGPETHFFVYVLKPIDNWRKTKLNQKQIELIFKRFRLKPEIEFEEKFKKEMIDKAEKDGISASLLLNEIMKYFSNKSCKKMRWIEKTPRHAKFMSEIIALYPNAKIMYITRDPRDVVSSTLRFVDFHSSRKRWWHCAKRAYRWNKEVSSALDRISHINKNHRILIKYESIIEKPEKELKKIMKFLGEKYNHSILEKFSENYDNVTVPSEESYKNLTSIGKIVDRRGIWKKRMDSKDADIIEIICAPVKRKIGYKTKKITYFDKIKRNLTILFLKILWIKEPIINSVTIYRESKSIVFVLKTYAKKYFQ